MQQLDFSVFRRGSELKFFYQEKTNVVKDVEVREPSCDIAENVNWCSQHGRPYGDSSKKLSLGLLYDPAIPFWGYLYKEYKNTNSKRCVQPYVYHGIFYNSQEVETT